MALLAELPPELILHIISFLTRETMDLDSKNRLPRYKPQRPELISDLPSVNALSQTNVAFHRTLDQTLYDLCASVAPLGHLALLFAVEHELESLVDKLVTAGVSLNTEFRFRHSRCGLLHIAAGKGLRGMVVKLLRMYGEEMRATVHRRNSHGVTALDWAARDGHVEIVRLLAPIHRDAMPSLVTEVETQKYLGRALLETARAGHLEISKYLISEGADVNLQDEEYGTPLYYAAMHLDLVQFLLASGADPNIHNEPFVPLFNASNIDVAEVLLLSGANLHAEDDERRNVLSHVTDIEMLRFFLERGVDPNHEDGLGGTPLHEACRHGTAWVELLLQFGVTMVEKKNWNRRTPVDIAMAMGSPDVVNMLEPLVQDPNLKSKIATWWERKGVIRR